MANEYYAKCLLQLRQKNLLRTLPKFKNISLNFAGNDYLNLAEHPKLIQQVQMKAILGIGSKASRSVLPQKEITLLENKIAKSKKTQSALIFQSGFQANVSVISALLDSKVLGRTPLVFTDRLIHASMHMGCQLSKVKQLRFQHVDYDHLTWLLEKYQSERIPKFILTESVFGMDGDKACLETLISLSKKHKAFLYVDEAHATGLFGEQGYGLTSQFGKEIDLTMGTFSKALGSSGAYIACSNTLKRYLVNRCQGFIYSTAPSMVQIAAMEAAWDLVPSLQEKVKNLFKQATWLREELHKKEFNTGNSTTNIIPIILNEAKATLALQKKLANKGILVGAIRSPSVAPNQSRLRIALTLAHSKEDIDRLLAAL